MPSTHRLRFDADSDVRGRISPAESLWHRPCTVRRKEVFLMFPTARKITQEAASRSRQMSSSSGAQLAKCLRKMTGAMVVGAIVAAGAGCGVEVGIAHPTAYYADYPPDTYIATTEPFYYEGHASYWYGGRWYYRDGAHWSHYDREPAGLQQRRMQGAPQRHSYAPSGGGRPASRSGGGRSGGHR
jgi:hypothetical protein